MRKWALMLVALVVAAFTVGSCFFRVSLDESLHFGTDLTESGAVQRVSRALSLGANPDNDFNGAVPLDAAIDAEYYHVFAVLIQRGARIGQMNPHLARLSLHPEVWAKIEPALVQQKLDPIEIRNQLSLRGAVSRN